MHDTTQSIKQLLDQQDRETQARLQGRDNYRTAQAKAQERGDLASTVPAKALTNAALGRVIEAADRLFKNAPPAAKASLELGIELGAARCAFLALQYAWNGVSESRTSTAVRIGSAVERELNAKSLSDGYPGLAAYVFDKYKKSRSAKHKQLALAWARKATDLPTLKDLGVTKGSLTSLGAKLLDTVIESAGLFEYSETTRRVGAGICTDLLVVLKKETLEAADRIDARAQWQQPVKPLMVTPPVPWDDTLQGGYLTPELKFELLKGASLGYLESLEEYDLSPALRAMNTLQGTAFRVSKKVLEVVQEVWEKDWAVGILPKREPKTKPPLPVLLLGNESAEERNAKIDTFKAEHPDEWIRWKKAAAEAIAWNESGERTSRLLDAQKLLDQAASVAEYDAFYSPVQMDFRTRLYYVANGLTPQGNDLAKGLLEFSRGVKLTAQGARSLAIAGATIWANGGIDKQSLAAREAWVQEHDGLIRACARDPLGNLWWAEADGGATAFTFLAFCFEWAAWKEHGAGYESHLILYADGKCNGSQHHAALMRSEREAAFVCMVPQLTPDDLYTRALDAVNARITARLDDETPVKKGSDSPTRGQLLRLVHGRLNRKIVKRACMTYSYGVTLMGVRDQLKADHPDFFKQFDKSMRKPLVQLLASEILAGVKETIKSSAVCMKFLQDVARVVAEAGLPLNWITPDGFAVEQKYEQFEATIVKTAISGGIRARLDKSDQVRRHFLDAVYETACKVLKNKEAAQRLLDDLHGMISYGTIKAILDGYRELLLAGVEGREPLRETIRQELEDALVGHHKAMVQDLVPVLEDLVTASFKYDNGGSTGRIEATLLSPTGELDVNKQIAAIAPNFIHSLDATALRLTVNACSAAGITDFAAVHDSYGVHAEHYAEMNRILREEFVRMYTEHDPLADLLAMARNSLPESEWHKLPALPERGTLDLELVKQADFFFA